MDEWYYTVRGERRGPIDLPALEKMSKAGVVSADDLVWHKGMAEWTPVSNIAELRAADVNGPAGAPRQRSKTSFQFEAAGPAQPPKLPKLDNSAGAEVSKKPARGALHELGWKISEAADLPEIEDVPIIEIVTGGLRRRSTTEEMEEEFAVGTRKTTPPIADLPSGWPKPIVFWRVLAALSITYLLMRAGWSEFHNLKFIPGIIIVGAFAVPISVVVFFFESNLPRNVSIYQTAKMICLGGAIGLIATMTLSTIIPGGGVGGFLPAILTGATEETGKMLALLLIASATRYRWQTNGLLFGAAIGAGFEGFETAGYAFEAGLHNLSFLNSIWDRALFAHGCHVIWTAIIGSAIWKVKGENPFTLSMLIEPVVIRRAIIAVVLHGLWDTAIPDISDNLKFIILSVLGWYIVLAILKQSLGEIETARKQIPRMTVPQN